jgi:hypothetical protein
MKAAVIWLSVILALSWAFHIAFVFASQSYSIRLKQEAYQDGVKEGIRRMVEAKTEELPLPVSEEEEVVKPERKMKNYLGTRRRDN